MEAAEGLFFDGIQGQGGEESIIVRADLPLPMAPGPAETGLSRGQLAVMGSLQKLLLHVHSYLSVKLSRC